MIKAITHSPITHITVLIILGLVLYAQTFDNDYVLDDFHVVKNNAAIRSLTNLPHFFSDFLNRSVFYASLTVNYAQGGLNPHGYHVVNVGIHIANALLVYALVLLLVLQAGSMDEVEASVKQWIPFFAALLFLIHPIQSMAVNHITTRSLLLCTFFYLSTIILFVLAYMRAQPLWLVCAGGAFMLCLGSKSVGITVPLMCMLMYFVRDVGGKKKIMIATILLLIFLGSVALLLTQGKVFQESSHGVYENVLTQIVVIPQYLLRAVYPVGLVPEYDIPVKMGIDSSVISSAFVLCVIVVVILFCNHIGRREYVFSIGWFLITLLPSSSIIPRMNTMLLYRLYLPMVGIAVSTSFFVAELTSTSHLKKISHVCMWGLGVVLCVLTILSNNVFESNLMLWKTIAKHYPNNYVVQYNLGTFLIADEDCNDAIVHLKKSIDLKSDYAPAHFHLGLALQKTGKFNDAAREYAYAIRLAPEKKKYLINLGSTYLEMKAYGRAILLYREYCKADKTNQFVYYNLYAAYRGLKRNAQALESIEKALALDPENNVILFDLGIFYQEQRMFPEAIRTYQKIVDRDNTHSGALNNLGTLFLQLGNTAKARKYFTEALKLDPDNKGIKQNLSKIAA